MNTKVRNTMPRRGAGLRDERVPHPQRMKHPIQKRPTAKPVRRENSVTTASAVLPLASKRSTERIEPKWAWHFRALLKLRERLARDGRAQRDDAAESLEPHSLDIADSASDQFDHDLALTHLSAEQEALHEVEKALGRIRGGTYGVCEATGLRIGAARLRAIPWTRFSREAQLRMETEGNSKREQMGKSASLHESVSEGFDEAETAGEQKPEPEPDDEFLSSASVPRTPLAHAVKRALAKGRRRSLH